MAVKIIDLSFFQRDAIKHFHHGRCSEAAHTPPLTETAPSLLALAADVATAVVLRAVDFTPCAST